MAQETFEAQAAILRSIMQRYDWSSADRVLLLEAERNLASLAALRKKCLDAADQEAVPEDLGDELCDEIIKLLQLPIVE